MQIRLNNYLNLMFLNTFNNGSQDISSPLAFAEGLFIFYKYFTEKEGFLHTNKYS
jgi:hypothetical protein